MRTLNNLLAGVAMLWAVNSTAADWYVDNAATGSRNGTSWANAWTNLNSVTGTSSGDTVYVSGGSTSKTYRDPFWTPPNGITMRIGQDSGHNGRAIFDSQGVNNAWIYGALKNVTIDGLYNGQKRFVVTNANGPSHWSIWCDGAADMTIRGVESWEAFRFNPGTNIHVQQCFVRPFPPTNGTPSYAILWAVRNKAAEAMAFTNNSVRQTVFELPRSTPHPSWGADGMTGGRCTTFESNILYTVTGMEDLDWQHGDGWQVVANGAEGSWCRIANNSFTNFANYGLYWEMTGAVSNVHVFNNYVTHTTDDTASSAAVGLVIACQGASGVTYSNLVVANNTVIDNYGRAGIAFADASAANTYQNCILANNLTYNSGVSGGEQAIRVGNSSGTNGLAIYGNKMIAGRLGTNTIETAQLAAAGGDNNLVTVSYSELSPSNNPRLLASDTAAIGAGFDLSSYFTTDADGNTRSATWDLGAFEWLNTLVIFTNNASGARVMGFRGLGMSVFPRILATATDTFNRANSDPMSTTMSDGVSVWSVGPGSWQDLKIVSNEAVDTNPGGSSGAAAVVVSPTFGADQSVSIVLGATIGGQMIIVRGDALLESGYAIMVDDSDTIIFTQLSSGTHSSISPLSVVNGLSFNAGETVTLTVTGSGPVELKAYNDGVEIGSYTDSSGVVTSGQPGFAAGENFFAGEIEGWSATDL